MSDLVKYEVELSVKANLMVRSAELEVGVLSGGDLFHFFIDSKPINFNGRHVIFERADPPLYMAINAAHIDMVTIVTRKA